MQRTVLELLLKVNITTMFSICGSVTKSFADAQTHMAKPAGEILGEDHARVGNKPSIRGETFSSFNNFHEFFTTKLIRWTSLVRVKK